MDAHPQLVLRMETTNVHYVVDIDAPHDVAAVAKRIDVSVELPD
jgi:hypothetical protein